MRKLLRRHHAKDDYRSTLCGERNPFCYAEPAKRNSKDRIPLTEAAEAKPEDVEFLRAKLRELKVQARDELEVLRRDRDQMREYKTIRDDHNKEVRGLIESVKAEREERDRINKEISEAKDRRTAIHAQLKSVYDEIRELRSNLVGSPSTDQR